MVADGGFIVVDGDLIVVDGDLLVVDGGCFFADYTLHRVFLPPQTNDLIRLAGIAPAPGICEAAFTNTLQKQQLTETC